MYLLYYVTKSDIKLNNQNSNFWYIKISYFKILLCLRFFQG